MQTRFHAQGSRPLRSLLVGATFLFAVSSCAEHNVGFNTEVQMPRPLKKPSNTAAADAALLSGQSAPERSQSGIATGPTIPTGRMVVEPLTSQPLPHLTGDKISINFDGITLPAFVNTVFGELLKVTFEIDPTVSQKDTPITMRTSEPISPDAFLAVVTETLRNHGIGVVYQNNVFRIVDAGTLKQDVPLIVRTRSLPNVPDEMRPVFMFVQLHAVQAGFLLPWLDMAFKGRIQVQGVNQVNGVLIIGKRDDVRAAIETIDVLDQPSMAGSRSLKISPAYWTAKTLADQLAIVLNAEGYATVVGPDNAQAVKLVPIPLLNIIIVFAASEKTLQHITEWVSQLDQPGQNISVNTQSTHYYPVQNTSAKLLADTLSRVLTGTGDSAPPALAAQQQQTLRAPSVPGAAQASMQADLPTPPLSSRGGRNITVDASHNAIIFQGTSEEFSQFRALAVQMDRAPLEVLIEATIAEVTLSEGESLGVTLNWNDASALMPISSAVKSDAGVIVNLVRDRGRLLANLNANANKNKITILSSPRVIASSGKSASLHVGTSVPTITTRQQSTLGTTGPNTGNNILQEVQYRETGVTLTIDPTINSNRRVELNIQQEVSEAQANKITDVQSPTIFTRNIQTTLSLNDGETVLLGGLISENVSKGNNGIPYLKDIPVLGNLFKTSSVGRTRIELIVLLTPYIIDGSEASIAVRDAFKEELTQLPPVPMANGGRAP